MGVLDNRWIARQTRPDLQRRPQAGTGNAQSRFGGWVEIRVPPANRALIAQLGFPRPEDWDRPLQRIHRKPTPVEERLSLRMNAMPPSDREHCETADHDHQG